MTPTVGAAVVGVLTGVGLGAACGVAEFGARRTAAGAGRSRLAGRVGPGRLCSLALVWSRVVDGCSSSPPALWWAARRESQARDGQLPDFVDAVVRSVGSGASLATALRDGAEVVGDPIRRELDGVDHDVELGVPWVSALAAWARRSANDDIGLLVTACTLGADMGRGTASALDGVATTLSDRRDVAAEARAAASQARASAAMLALLPVLFTAVLAAIDPGSLRVLVGTPVGLACLTAAVGLDAIGAWWMRRLIASVA